MVRRLYAGSDEIVKRYVGSDLTHLIEWREKVEEVDLPYAPVQWNDDPTLYVGTNISQRSPVRGYEKYKYLEEVVNGTITGRTKDRILLERVESIASIVRRGVKPLPINYLGKNIVYKTEMNPALGINMHSQYQPWALTINRYDYYKISFYSNTTINRYVHLFNKNTQTISSSLGTIPPGGSLRIAGTRLVNSSFPDGVTGNFTSSYVDTNGTTLIIEKD